MVVAVYGLLRFDPIAVPAFVAAGNALEIAASAVRRDHAEALVDAAIAIAVAALVAWGVTRWLARASSPT
jgi:hypothetical protein